MIKEILISNEGYIHCKSNFYTSTDVLQQYMKFNFRTGINKLVGDIDSGIWGVSYLLSMFNYDVNKALLFNPLTAVVDGCEMPLKELTKKCCYLDQVVDPLFSGKRKTVKNLLKTGIYKSGIHQNVEEICQLFMLDAERITRPIQHTGNERFRAMAAVGYAHGKQVFCFPWLSKKMFDYYNNNILYLLDIFEKLGVIVILPIGR